MKNLVRNTVRFSIIFLVATLFSLTLAYSILYINELLKISGFRSLILYKDVFYMTFAIIDLLTMYLILRFADYILPFYLLLYFITSSFEGTLNMKLGLTTLSLYIVLRYIYRKEPNIRIRYPIRKSLLGTFLIIFIFWLIYRLFSFSRDAIQRFIVEWIYKSPVEIKEFYGVIIKTILGKIILASIILGLSIWVILEISDLLSAWFSTAKSISMESNKFVKKDIDLLIAGNTKEERALRWGAQLSLSILLYPFFLTLSIYYQKIAKVLTLPSKTYYLFLIIMYLFSLLLSKYLAKILIMTGLSTFKPNIPRVFSFKKFIITIVTIILVFTVISYIEGINSLNVISTAFGVGKNYRDPLAPYILKVNKFPLIISAYMREVENLLRILIKIFWGS